MLGKSVVTGAKGLDEGGVKEGEEGPVLLRPGVRKGWGSQVLCGKAFGRRRWREGEKGQNVLLNR